MNLHISDLTKALVKRSLALPIKIYNTRIIWKRSLLRNGIYRYNWKKHKSRRKWLPYEQYRLMMYMRVHNERMHYNVNKYYAALLKKPRSDRLNKKWNYKWWKPEAKKKRRTKYIFKQWMTAYKSLLLNAKNNKLQKKKIKIIRQQYMKLCAKLQKVANTRILLSKRSGNIKLLRRISKVLKKAKRDATLYVKYKKAISNIVISNKKKRKEKKRREKKKSKKKHKMKKKRKEVKK